MRSFPTSSLLAFCLAVTCCATQALVSAGQVRAADGRSDKERGLIGVLRGDAPEADKALACKELAVFGSADAVPDLAKLLDNERLASWARIPLEAIPDPACDRALREAVGRLSGRLRVGAINSLGVRRDSGAVELLAKLLVDGDATVVDAAAAALGNIGTAAAVVPLRKGLESAVPSARAAAAEGCILCAERLLAAGQAAAAATLADAVRQANVPRMRIVEATRGGDSGPGGSGRAAAARDAPVFRSGPPSHRAQYHTRNTRGWNRAGTGRRAGADVTRSGWCPDRGLG